jgi:hypothetical protein
MQITSDVLIIPECAGTLTSAQAIKSSRSRSTPRVRRFQARLKSKKLCANCGKSAPAEYRTLCKSCLLSRSENEAARRLRIKAGAR